jgi:hypothetical protein
VLPYLDSLTPDTQIVGGDITLQGTGFSATSNEDCAVYIGALECSIVSWGNDEIEITIPDGVAPDYLTITNSAGTSNGIMFTPKPNILSFAPTRTWVGQELAISGTSFGADIGASTVAFAGPVTALPADIVSWSDSVIILRVPAGARQGNVVVKVNDIDSEGEFLLIVLTPPGLGGLGQY